jgi:hypothetical protein
MVLIYLWLIGGPVADVLIAIAMTTLVRRSLICLSHPNFHSDVCSFSRPKATPRRAT